MLCERGEYNKRSQTTSSNLQEWCNNTISENTINSPQNTPVQTKNHIQTWPRSIHSRLAQDKTIRKTKMKKYLKFSWMLMPYRQLQTSQITLQYNNYDRQSHKMITYNRSKLYHQRLPREQRSNTTRHVNILVILRWYGSDWWGYTLRQTCSNTWVIEKNRH